MRAHRESISAFAFFKDGRRVITAIKDTTLQIWDLQNGTLLGGPFSFKERHMYSVAISSDERRIVSGGYEAIIIWDVESNQMIFNRLVKLECLQLVCLVCFSPDGKILAGGSSSKTAIICDVETGAVLGTLKDHPYFVDDLAFSPDGLKLVSGSRDAIRVWRTDDTELLLQINVNSRIHSVAWSPDGQQLVSVSSGMKTVNFWNSLNGDQIGELCTGFTRSIDSITISSDHDGSVITTSHDKIVQLWTRTTKGQVLEPTIGVESVAISSNSELPVSGDDQGKAWLQSIKDILEQGKIKEGEEAQRQQFPFRRDTQVCFNPLLFRLYYQTRSCSIQIFAMDTAVRNAFVAGDLHTIEDLLTQEIDVDGNNHNSYANRSIVRVRNSDWDNALQDAVKVKRSAYHDACDIDFAW
jgi:WD40 repeat protein